ncbi:hypothetical protein [Micromonospora sp. U21]|uniref:hypothetical protein n=1 Tax=Micromonospora sp. U21 TaxID=2824899 RepID=UPI001B37A5E1|nr:hypothetical protein [Micromonospora sp. U21]MBQ0905331.1 hypothetical protein [Micromonospora sp. U21]
MLAKLDRPVKPGLAAKALGIDYSDLPKLGHPWTKKNVRSLRDSTPGWLNEARRRHATRVQQASEARAAELDAELARLGYDAPDLGAVDQAALYIDAAVTHLTTVTRCSEDEADRAAWRRWPKSMAAEEDYADQDA